MDVSPGPFRLSAAFGKRMFDAEGGSIINVSSVAAMEPTPNETAYGAAKAGVHAITSHSHVSTGPKSSELHHARTISHRHLKSLGYGSIQQKAETDIALQRGGEADEIGAALYFASAASVTRPEQSLKSMVVPVGQLADS